jgi:orotate phosphoribosyltransferase
VIHYRSIATMSDDARSWLQRLPSDIDLIVGIPRSGLLVASILAIHRNVLLADVDGFIKGRVMGAGFRYDRSLDAGSVQPRRILVVDDTLNSGREMARVRTKIAAAHRPGQVLYGAMYVTPGSEQLLDYFYQVVPLPRVFEWNIFHNDILACSCVDIDGVLCRDPAPEENDDGEQYEVFIRHVNACLRPTVKIRYLVTCRLEKYRRQTEEWLRKWDIRYEQLLMMSYPDKESRVKEAKYSRFKADVYSQTSAALFIESSVTQASDIATQAGKPVYCVETGRIVYPRPQEEAVARIRRFADLCRHHPVEALARVVKRAKRTVRHVAP